MLIKYGYMIFARKQFRYALEFMEKKGVVESFEENRHILYSTFVVKADPKGHLILMKAVNNF